MLFASCLLPLAPCLLPLAFWPLPLSEIGDFATFTPADGMSDISINVSNFTLHSIYYSGEELNITFFLKNTNKNGFTVKLKNTVSYFDWTMNKKLRLLKIDDEGGSFAQDISFNLQRPELVSYDQLFIFEDADEIKIAFLALAENITLHYFDHGMGRSWPYD